MAAVGDLVAGRYRIGRELGRGTSGHVFIARDEHLDREVAIKVLAPDAHAQDEIASRFEHEIRVTARLNHPGIVAVFESAEDDAGTPCYMMSLARGETLEARLDRLRQSASPWVELPLSERLGLMLKLLDIAGYAHTKGIVHRDLKPANVVLGAFGEVWILDWGLARALQDERGSITGTYQAMFEPEKPKPEAATIIMPDEAGEQAPTERMKKDTTRSHDSSSARRSVRLRTDTNLKPINLGRQTQYGQVLGSPAYMSPEQAAGNANTVDQRADVYALGVMLYELLCLRTPCELKDGEKVGALIERVRQGERTAMTAHWPDAPPALTAICERALARDPQSRFSDCGSFAAELRTLLTQLTASYAEMERIRLAREREGAWLPAGRWDYGANPDPAPFNGSSLAWCGEQVGQVHHPELHGVLIGGYGVQWYPLDLEVGDDVRIVADVEVLAGHEVWFCVRGRWGSPCYQFRIGAYDGRWMLICRAGGSADPTGAEILTMRPLRGQDATTTRQNRSRKPWRIAIEVEGSHLQLSVDDHEPLAFRDLRPITLPPGAHLAVATWHSQASIRRLQVERRRSPLMVPGYAIGAELLRIGQQDRGLAWLDRFIAEHDGSAEAIDARFMRCMALTHGGSVAEAADALRAFLGDHLEHPLSQDAIFALAALRLAQEGGGMRAAVREMLAWQESGDTVRTRFALWYLQQSMGRFSQQGLTPAGEEELRDLSHLMRGSSDQSAVSATASWVLGNALRRHLNRVVDSNDDAGLTATRAAMRRVREYGFPLSIRDQRLGPDYAVLAHHIQVVDDPSETILCIGHGAGTPLAIHDFIRDVLVLASMGCSGQLRSALAGDDLPPLERLLRSGLLAEAGDREAAQADLQACFQLTDMLETERTDLIMLFAARFGCFALGYLPWQLVDEGLATVRDDLLYHALRAMGAWICEHHGHRETALGLYEELARQGSGFAIVGQLGKVRVQGA